MRWMRRIMFLLLLPSFGSMLADEAAKDSGNAVKGKTEKKKRQAERLDLNQIDLEQVEEDWDSTPTKPMIDVNRSVKIREIVEPSGEYSYASFGRPDPFAAPAALMDPGTSEGASVTPEGKEIKIISVLQRYPLSDLNVKGVWQLSTGQVRAVVLTPKGEGVVVKEGDPISSGKVLSVTREQMTVRLYRLRSDGVREYEDVAMKIGAADNANSGVIKLEPGKDPVFSSSEENRPMPVAPLGRALDAPAAPASPVGAAAGATAPAAGMPVAKPVEKGLDPVVPRAPK